MPRRRDGRFAAGQATRILAWAIFAQVLGGIINAALQTGHLPTSQPNAAELIFAVADSIQAGVVEELVVLAFVVVTLRQAGRGWWEITLVALVLRGSYHIYYGPGVVGILVWAALFYWIYLRFRSLILLMICHAGLGHGGVPLATMAGRRRRRRPGRGRASGRGADHLAGRAERPGAGPSPFYPQPRAGAAGVAARPRRRPLLAMVGRSALDRLRVRPVSRS